MGQSFFKVILKIRVFLSNAHQIKEWGRKDPKISYQNNK